MSINKVVLAYSGGLDTSIIIPWLKDNYNCEVIAVVVNVGQNDDFNEIKNRAIQTGASKVYVEDVKEEFFNEYILPTLKAGAVYEGKYLLGTSMARPLIAKKLVEIAKKENADAIAHGATGKGNDQVRFETTIKALLPNIKVIAPWRIWDLKSREEEIEYAKKKGINIPFKKDDSYSMDGNIWHLSHEGLDLEDTNNSPDFNKVLKITKNPFEINDQPEKITIEFEKGIPVKLNGQKLSGIEILENLNKLGSEHGIGIADIVENRLVGMKSRGVYETPGGTILFYAHRELEYLCLDRSTMHFKDLVAIRFAELVYDGLWFSQLREALSAFIDKTQENVNGQVTLTLYRGNIYSSGSSSPNSLYLKDLATFEEDDMYNQKDAEGFINLFSLPLKVYGIVNKKGSDNN
ncbi:argininosuccinate synthase [Caldicellulosiruptoraceae bacterium PP1]